MKSYFVKTLAVVFALVIFTGVLTSCKKNSVNTDSSNADNTVASSVSDSENTDGEESIEKTTKKGETIKEEKTTKEDETAKKGETTKVGEKTSSDNSSKKTSPSKKTITLTSGLTSSDVSEVLTYYKLVAKKNTDLKMKKEMSMAYLNVGTLIIDGESDSPNREKGLSYFQKGADFALGFAGGKVSFPGDPSAIQTSDWQSAKAVNDGTYTTVTVNVKPQVDSYNGKEYEGSVGRSMQVLPGFDTAITTINNFPLISMTADFAHGDVKIEYQNPTIKIKVLNSTGELVKDSCKWSYRTKIYLNDLNATMKVTKNHTVEIKNSNGAVDYSVNY